MKSTDLTSFWLKELEARPVFTAVIVAFLIRALALFLGFQDYWGDSFHNLIMSKLTLENDWVYSDFKDRHLTWLPAFRYWGSLVIWITGSAKLITLNIANSLLGVLLVGFGSWLVRERVGKKTALLAGLLLALLPYLIVFSYINMAEGFGALILLLWVIGVDKNQWMLIIVSAFIAALTRYELLFFLGIGCLYLMASSKKKAVFSTAMGVGFGLVIWSWWSYLNSGDLLNWLWMRIQSTTLSTGFYAQDVNILKRFVVLPLFAILQAFPLVIAFIWLKKTEFSVKKYSLSMFTGSLLIAGLVFFGYAQTSVIVYPDPRYLVMILPITVVWFCLIWQQGYFRPFISSRIILLITILSLFQLIIPYYRQFSLQPRIEMGIWLQENLKDNETVWSDNAVSIVSSELPVTQFKSSLELEVGGISELKDIESLLRKWEIKYLTVYPAPYTTAHQIYPEVLGQSPFEKNGITFIPVFSYQSYQMQKGSVHDYLRMKFESGAQPASIWKLYYE